MSSYQRAKEALGKRLRELRLDARLTGRELAALRGWPPSKVSKIEAGKQKPTDADIEDWAAACGRPAVVPDLIASLRSLEDMYVEFRRMFRAGLAAKQASIAEIEATTTVTRNFEHCFVPGLLQTAEYARYRFAEGDTGDEARGAPKTQTELDEAVAARIQRQQVLHNAGKRHHFVITEAVLHLLLCPPDVMAGQLGQLLSLTTLQTIRLGVIGFESQMPVAPVHGFWIYDDRVVYIEHYTGELKLTQPSEIAAYLSVFDKLARTASYGAGARTIIGRALNDLSC